MKAAAFPLSHLALGHAVKVCSPGAGDFCAGFIALFLLPKPMCFNNILCNLSAHVAGKAYGEPPGFCNYRIPPPLPRER